MTHFWEWCILPMFLTKMTLTQSDSLWLIVTECVSWRTWRFFLGIAFKKKTFFHGAIRPSNIGGEMLHLSWAPQTWGIILMEFGFTNYTVMEAFIQSINVNKSNSVQFYPYFTFVSKVAYMDWNQAGEKTEENEIRWWQALDSGRSSAFRWEPRLLWIQ